MDIFYHNGDFFEKSALQFGFDNRAFQYGDRFFETFFATPSQIYFGKDHLGRAKKASNILGYNSPQELESDHFQRVIKSLLKKNHIEGTARLKLVVSRKSGGKYTAQTNEADVFMSCEPSEGHQVRTKDELGKAGSIVLQRSIFSPYKIFSLPYVLAGNEAKQNGWGDVVLCTHEGVVAECSMSNLFWIEGDNNLYTPPLSTGCLEGIMRKNFMAHFSVKEKEITWGGLMETANGVFSLNASGFFSFKKLGAKQLFTSTETLDEQLLQVLKASKSHLPL